MEEWKEYRLGEVVAMKNGKKRPTEEGLYPVYGGNGIMGYVSSYNSENTIIIGRVGAYCGNVYYCKGKCWVSDNAISVKTNDGFNIVFLFYLMQTLNLHNQHIGGAQPLMTQDIIGNFNIRVPSLRIQDKIALTLSLLDDKIVLNQKINSNLEEQAKALFKSWFIDFEPFKGGKFVDSELGKIPEGWKVLSLDEIANYLNGLAMQKYRPATGEQNLPVLKIKELGQGYCDASCDKCSSKVPSQYIVNDGDVIFSWSGTLMVDLWCGGICGLNQHLFKVSSEDYPKWFYLMWTLEHLNRFIHIAKDKAVTMGHIKREELHKAKVVVPTTPIFNKANMLFAPIVDEMINTRISNRKLSVVRDTLLPKLMSGEIDVEHSKLLFILRLSSILSSRKESIVAILCCMTLEGMLQIILSNVLRVIVLKTLP